jgi:2-oxoisovalerate dehydrogenase E1 component
VNTGGKYFAHKLLDERLVILSQTAGNRVYGLEPGIYLVDVVIPGGQTLSRVVDLERSTDATINLSLKEPEIINLDPGRLPGDPLPPSSKRRIRLLTNIPFDEAFAVSTESRISQVRDVGDHQVLLLRPGLGISFVEFASPEGESFAIALPARGDLSAGCEKCWGTLDRKEGRLHPNVYMGESVADMARQYMECGRNTEAIGVVQSRPFRDRLEADPFRLALAGYLYLRMGDLAHAEKWALHLTEKFRWLPDGSLIRAELLARDGHHTGAEELLSFACSQGLPIFSDGFSILVTRLHQYSLYRDKAPQSSGSSLAERATKLAPFVDWNSLLLTFKNYVLCDPTIGDSVAVKDIAHSTNALPATFAFHPRDYLARLDYHERRPTPRNRFGDFEKSDLLSVFRLMHLSRQLDNREILLKRQQKIFFQISGAGHEAIQIAASQILQPGKDWAFVYYRDRALCLGLGMSPQEMLNQAVGNASSQGGRQAPSFFSSAPLHIFSSAGGVAANFTQAIGCAQANRIVDSDKRLIVLVSGGDGATNEGEFWEALNVACIEKLSTLFLIEDNGYAISAPVSRTLAGGSIAELVQTFPNLLVREVDGTDFPASLQIMQEASAWCREGQGPALVHARVVRLYGHSLSDDESTYRSRENLAREARRDPLENLQATLISSGLATEGELEGITQEVEQEIQVATANALDQPIPSIEEADKFIYSEVTEKAHPLPNPKSGVSSEPEATMADCINRTLADEMAANDRVVVFGLDVADLDGEELAAGTLKGRGGLFKITIGLQRRFGNERCFNSPVAESSIVGRAIGMALAGLRPVIEIQFGDDIWRAMLQIRNELAGIRWRTFNEYSCPVVIRVAVGGYLTGGGPYFSQCVESAFAHIPGLRVVMPSTALDACGLLRTAIRCDDPVLFLEPKRLYRERWGRVSYPGSDFMIPFGKASVILEGNDVTVITYGNVVPRALRAVQQASQQFNIAAELIDLRSLSPYDWPAIRDSVRKTNRVIIVHEDWQSWGYGAELAARIAQELFHDLDAPVTRIAGKDRWVPYQPVLEDNTLPQPDDILAGIVKICKV